jgi:exopolyphosphatase/pppGpp-phosphohydrolase
VSSPPPGALTVSVGDRSIGVEMVGGGSWTLPVGPATLVDGDLADTDPPSPASLTNALGLVRDHLEDVIIEAPIVAAAPALVLRGRHVGTLARVEVGANEVPADYVLARSDADEVFRTLVAEPAAERCHNPGLPPEEVDTVVGTCCVVLTFLRRLDLQAATVETEES